MNVRRGGQRAGLIVIVLAVVAVVVFGIFFVGFPGKTQTTIPPSTDQAFFIQNNLSRTAALAQWLMSPLDQASQKPGYDSAYGMVRGGNWGGGFQNGFVLIDTQLILAKSLDYFNSQSGVHTNIEGNMRQWLNSTFVNPATGVAGSYGGDDRREVMFGKVVPCVNDDSGQVYYVRNHTLTDPVPIATALPTFCSGDGPGPMNVYSLWIELYYLKGEYQKAQSMFMVTLSGWTATQGTGVGGTSGGYFSSTFDAGNCKSSRVLGYWLEMARATGYWNMNSQARETALQAMDELWAHQGADGGISANYPGCGSSRESGESTGLALVAFDPRVPAWFGGHSNVSAAQVAAPVNGVGVGLASYPASVGGLCLAAAVRVVDEAAREDSPA